VLPVHHDHHSPRFHELERQYLASMAYAQPVTTDATICTPEELREAASKFLAEDPTTLEFDKGGFRTAV